MILLAFGDFAGQKEILEQDRGLSLYCFFEERRPLFGDDPPFCCEGASAFRRGEESRLSFFHITRNVVLLEI